MSETLLPYARIISALNVEDEALRAFCVSLIYNQTVDEYISQRHLRFCSQQIEGTFFSHLLALTELALDSCGFLGGQFS
ncbi:hypothetical protein [Endozoicomonas sp. Mp262]|uniref:hypothetical protein n=1 Tax=Endozoicomonas sp. Mp262 TaxID=2919499 RepID=UPI0021D910EA